MVTLAHIRGQPRVVEQLGRALRQGRVPHAYLFTGPPGVGKHTTGLALAAAMNCERAPSEGCASCPACQRIASGCHPDVVTLERQGASQTIPIETIRSLVIPALGLAPHEGRARFFLIEEATSLLGPAANALLKTLEEPPARTHFVLCTSSPGELLPTIRSRCQRVQFQPLAADLKAELEGEDAAANRQAVDQLLAVVGRGDRLALAKLAEAIAGDRAQTARTVRLLAQALHQQARAAADAGEMSRAGMLAAGAARALACEVALTLHNAHALLAIEDLVRELERLGADLAECAPSASPVTAADPARGSGAGSPIRRGADR